MAERSAAEKAKQGGIGDTIRVVVEALLIALVFRTFLYHPFNIPSSSMEPTLLIGDYLFVSKFSYGYSRYSFPFVDFSFIHGRVWEGKPERGDIVVFRPPGDLDTDYIKRAIGLPGDKIQMVDGVLHINGQAVPHELIGERAASNGFGGVVREYREILPNGVSYTTYDADPNGSGDNTRVYEVPPDHYFLMGDNRDNSQDSRYPNPVGFVPAENLIGRAEIIFFSVNKPPAWAIWQWPWTVRVDRLLDPL